jgi:hypothetical protein
MQVSGKKAQRDWTIVNRGETSALGRQAKSHSKLTHDGTRKVFGGLGSCKGVR